MDLSSTTHTVARVASKGRENSPQPAYQAINASLSAFGKHLPTMKPAGSLWPSSADSERGITSGTFYGNLQRHLKNAGLPAAGVHVFRHSAAKLRRQVGESVEDVSRFLDHSSLAVTTVYLRKLEGDQDRTWVRVAAAIGISAERRSAPLSRASANRPVGSSPSCQRGSSLRGLNLSSR